jgi:hypothetical protein
MIRIGSVLLALLMMTTRAEAQGLSPLVKYGKWVLAAGAVGMNYQALLAHNRADDSFNALETRCLEVQQRCAQGPSGEYLDPTSEALYQNTLEHDHTARNWLIGGEAALAGAAALFVWDLSSPKGRPKNIPFEPEIRSIRGGTGFGLRVAF